MDKENKTEKTPTSLPLLTFRDRLAQLKYAGIQHGDDRNMGQVLSVGKDFITMLMPSDSQSGFREMLIPFSQMDLVVTLSKEEYEEGVKHAQNSRAAREGDIGALLKKLMN